MSVTAIARLHPADASPAATLALGIGVPAAAAASSRHGDDLTVVGDDARAASACAVVCDGGIRVALIAPVHARAAPPAGRCAVAADADADRVAGLDVVISGDETGEAARGTVVVFARSTVSADRVDAHDSDVGGHGERLFLAGAPEFIGIAGEDRDTAVSALGAVEVGAGIVRDVGGAAAASRAVGCGVVAACATVEAATAAAGRARDV
ncbi:MAG: hypothetical protein M3Y52_10145 [Actinomycetota bacterium]|nr:hypothetical protein [Actinomycetota bacterium]